MTDTNTAPEVVLDLETGEPLDLTGWTQNGSVHVRDDKGNLWEHRSYMTDVDEDGDCSYDVITGRILIEAAPEPEPEEELELPLEEGAGEEPVE